MKLLFINGSPQKKGTVAQLLKIVEGTIDAPSKGYKCDVCDNCVWISHGSDMGYKYTPSKGA